MLSNNKLLKGGILIFSDIILTDNCNSKELDEVYKRVNIKSLETHQSYIEKAENNGLKYINSIEYQDSMLYHYKNIRDIMKDGRLPITFVDSS